MNHEYGAIAARLCGSLLIWMVVLFTVAAAVYGISGSGDLLAREMLCCAPPGTTGLPEDEYAGVGRMTAGYLTGKEEVFQYTFSDAEGRVFTCFQSYEADHMADCRELIALAGMMRCITGAAAMLLVCAGLMLRRRRDFANGMFTGLCTAAALAAGIAVWAFVDFDGLFVTFHRLAFTNEGWLLDPRTDLLIRLMPTSFFVALGTKIMIGMIFSALILYAAAIAIQKNKGNAAQ